ncbi:hypothetical protein KUCAC02_018126 [Chaenocephalus aceratus]|uniref:Uncharacterized protein n=1 Tax=Chaenocephalus aceratus TaxID=36190 RepID=A0ACB9W7I4_CHAAC|nr:hypothetical protein KUCAC02_018126 [Chaenocephalus aceratus]
MAPRGMIAVTTVLLCFILGLLGPAPTALGSHMGNACSYKGYREQTTKENCNIEAIIFYTVRKNEVCATQKDEWVRKTLELLSSKLKKMSSAASKTAMRKTVNPALKNDGGSFVSTTATFPHTTED